MKLHSPGLAGRLAIVTAVLVTVAIAAVFLSNARSLRRLAEAEGLARLELAVTSARESLRAGTENLLSAARVLAERPTLERLLSEREEAALAPYLERYCEGNELSGCALLAGRTLLAVSGAEIDWPVVIAAADRQGERFLVTGAARNTLLGGAMARVDLQPSVAALVVRRMDDALARELGERAGLEIRIVDYASYRPGMGPLAVVNTDALSSGRPEAAVVRSQGVYASALTVTATDGQTVALVQALLPIDEVMGSVAAVTHRMMAVAFVIAALAICAGALIARQWISGVHRLTESARRIGAGDLAASIPEERGRELGVLAGTMDEMRRNLVSLTGELRRREAEAQAVLGGIVEGVYAVDAARRIRFLNPQAEVLLGLPATAALGRFCGDVLKPEPDAGGRRPCETSCPILSARLRGSTEAVERIEPCAGRRRKVVIASAAPADGLQVQVLRDETELEAVRRMRDSILANISHEFRTPLAAQLASIELLRDSIETATPAQQRQLVATLERGAQRLTWLIDNLLESVRIESGQLAIREQRVQLSDVVARALELIGPLVEQRGQAVRVGAGVAVLPSIDGDLQRLTQVVVNLIANASKYAPEQTIIDIDATFANDEVVFWVDDDGPGPVDQETAVLFEQFRRSGTREPDESGLGLGLFIVRSIVERHRGRVTLVRTPQGRTRVRVQVPAELPAGGDRRATRPRARPAESPP